MRARATAARSKGGEGFRRTLALALATLPVGGCSPLAVVNGLTPDTGYALTRDLAYGADPRQRLDVYVPEASAAPHPVVVFFYGGRWQAGARADYRFAAQALAERGFLVVVPDYRLYPAVRFPAFVADGAAAVAWVEDHAARFGGDPANIHLMGHSAGAHIAALLATDRRYLEAAGSAPERIAGVIGLAGPYDFLPLTSADLRDTFGPPARFPESQPINYVDGDEPPFLLLHGAKDTTVEPANSESLAARLGASGVPVKLVLYPDLDHGEIVGALAAPFRGWAPVLEDVVTFVHGAHAP